MIGAWNTMREQRINRKHFGAVLEKLENFEVIECEPCGFRHIMPIPSPRELEEVYRDQYYSIDKPLYFERYKEDLDWWNLTYSERYDKFEEFLPQNRRRILDVGSGPGYFLLHGKKRGWEAVGIEPSKQAARYSKDLGLKIIEEFLDGKMVESLGRFDVVHMSQLLEHTPDPIEILNLSVKLLFPGGLVCITVPNDYNPFQRALRQACGYKPWWVAPPHHINYFSHDSLTRLLLNNGLEIVDHSTTFPIDMFLLMGDNYLDNDTLGRECHKKRMNFEKNLDKAGMGNLKAELYTALAKLGIGREIMLTARRR